MVKVYKMIHTHMYIVHIYDTMGVYIHLHTVKCVTVV